MTQPAMERIHSGLRVIFMTKKYRVQLYFSTSDYEGHLTFHFVADSRIIVIAFGQTDQRVKAVGKISYRSVDTISPFFSCLLAYSRNFQELLARWVTYAMR